MPYAPLAGDLEAELPGIDEAAVREQTLRDSPGFRIAKARAEHARASLARARADRLPNFFVRGGAGHNFERTQRGSEVGTEFFLEIGIPLPIFDRNQGTIAQAEAQLRLAEAELRRTAPPATGTAATARVRPASRSR